MTGQEELKDEDGTSQPPVSNPAEKGMNTFHTFLDPLRDSAEVRQKVMSAQELVSDRLNTVKQGLKDVKQGKEPVGVVEIREGRKYARNVLQEKWRAGMAGRGEDRALEASAMCFGPEDKVLCATTAWQSDVDGWKTVECIFDSGASELVCPASMAPLWPIEDSPGSLVGLHYLSASGGRIPNRGQQR